MLQYTLFSLALICVLLGGAGIAMSEVKETLFPAAKPMRVVQLDLDYVYDTDPDQLERNINALVSRIADMKITAVFLQGFADPNGTELASALYFPNDYLPMRANLFGRMVNELKTKANVKVYGWLPVLSFDFGNTSMPVMAWDPKTGETAPAPNYYHRASPFDPVARAKIDGIFEAMAKAGPIDGILFHDDALLSDFEDGSPAALLAYQRAGLPASIETLRSDPLIFKKWTAFKTDLLISFTNEIKKHVELYRSPLITVRNIYAPLALNPVSQDWFAQDYDKFLASYDYTAIEAMPAMENVPEDEANDWMKNLVSVIANHKNGLKRTIFELQSVDWNKAARGEDRAVPAETLGAEMEYLTSVGALNFGYYPDDFVTNTPNAEMLHKDFSLPTDQYKP